MARWTRPTKDTKFHIDLDWWQEQKQDFRLFLLGQLCEDCRKRFANHWDTEEVDWVDPDTAEVRKTDGLRECLRKQCAQEPDFINEGLPLTAAVFRLLVLHDRPMSPAEMHRYITWKQPDVILRTLTGREIYLGIRPVPSAN